MSTCGHQFQGRDGSDWVLSTSVGFLDGSTTASRILQELFKKRCRNLPSDTRRKCPKTVIDSSAKKALPAKKKDEPEETLIVRKIPGTSALENFDESQHLDGCPIKWLYNKRLLEKKKRFTVQRLCCKDLLRKEEVKREKGHNIRDRTPVEIKIHKINLAEKYTADFDEIYTEKSEHSKDFEDRRKQLAAKLNCKLHDDSQEEPPYETFSEAKFRHNYFPPRPLLGLKPLLSVLLSPHKTNCCCLVTELRGTAPRSKGRGASLSIRSLDFSLPQPEPHPLRTPDALRWGSKSNVKPRKLQIPNQIIVKLDQKKQNLETQNNVKGIHCNPLVKKASEQRKQTKSLSSLFYELRGKTSQNEEVFEEMIRDLTPEGQFKMKRFLNVNLENWDSRGEGRTTGGRREKLMEEELGSAKDLNLICGKIHFFKKVCPKAMKPQHMPRPMTSSGLKTCYNPIFLPRSPVVPNV